MNYVTLWSVYLKMKDKGSLNEGGHGGTGLFAPPTVPLL